jgi:drug/metabolite transporter (DMT)-like permease
LVAAVLWAIGAAWTKHLTLPEGKSVSAAAQMLTGGAMMLVPAFVLGDLHRVDWGHLKLLPVASFAYLVVFASLLAFTSYVWLIHREPVSKVASYAYVNPVIAVVVGYFLGSEPLTWKTAMGSALVLVAVFAVTSRSKEERTSELEAPAEEISKLELAEVVHPKAE